MSDYSDIDRYRYSITSVCITIHGAITGSGNLLSDDHLNKIIDWLFWRITEGWKPTILANSISHRRYDIAIRNLARATITMAALR